MKHHHILICPVCRRKHKLEQALEPLNGQSDRTFSCAEGHCFDHAAVGYLNLLPPSGKKTHGDNKEMIAARRKLLDSALYEPLRTELIELLCKHLPEQAVIWDSGCGEGYYTAEVARKGSALGWSVYASDLSKDALKGCAKRSAELNLIAASAYALPAASASCDAVLCLFAPQASEEFWRMLKPNGLVIQAVPGERHLFGLKEAIYRSPYENSVKREPPKGFRIADCVELKQTVTITDRSLIESLFNMTPYAYRTDSDGLEKIHSIETLVTELHFYLFVYQKCAM